MSKLSDDQIIKINEEIDKGFIKKMKHPVYQLFILNYSDKCLYENYWSETVKICRGLIIDENNVIVSRPFDKFFNLNEREETLEENLPNEIPIFYEKLDGSLGISYFVGEELFIATRGSFSSDQSREANFFIKKFDCSLFDKNNTYLFEIITSCNDFNLVEYNFEDLVLLAVRETKTGYYKDYISEAKRIGLRYAREFHFVSMKEVIKYVNKQSPSMLEGIVVYYPVTNFRLKVKNVNFLKVMKLLNKFSIERFVFDSLYDKKMVDLLFIKQSFPDLKEKIDKITSCFLEDFECIFVKGRNILLNELSLFSTRKEKALFILEKYKDISSVLFLLLDNKEEELRNQIWKIIYRKYFGGKEKK